MNFLEIREQFPITKVVLPAINGIAERPLIFMDHGASTHAPQRVIDVYMDVIMKKYANVHRGEHTLSQISSDLIDHVPEMVGKLAGVSDLEGNGMGVVLTTNTTSSLDLASHIMAEQPGDYVTTEIEHHSNDLPHRRRGKVHHVLADERGLLQYDMLQEILDNHEVKLVSITAGSNVTGYMPDLDKIARMAHSAGAKVLVDAAQRMAHAPINVKPKDHPEHIDFLAGGGHKMYAPMGASFLIVDQELSDEAPPYIPAGGTVDLVTLDEVMFSKGPARHSFGTPNIAGSIALGEAAKFLMEVGLNNIRKHEVELLDYALKGLSQIEGFELLGDIPLDKKIGVISFNIDDLPHSHVSKELDHRAGIATRNGCFCAHPYLMKLLNITDEHLENMKRKVREGTFQYEEGAVRATLGIYNTKEEVDKLITTVEDIEKNPRL